MDEKLSNRARHTTNILKKYTEQYNQVDSKQESKYTSQAIQEIGMLWHNLNYKGETFQSLRTPKRLIIGSSKRKKLRNAVKSNAKFKSAKHKSVKDKSDQHKTAKTKKKVKFRFSKTKERSSTFSPKKLDSSVELYGMKVKEDDLAHYLSMVWPTIITILDHDDQLDINNKEKDKNNTPSIDKELKVLFLGMNILSFCY